MGLFDKFKYSLAKTRAVIVSKFVSPQWNAEEMERAFLAADFGPSLAADLIAGVRKRLELNPLATVEDAMNAAREELISFFRTVQHPKLPNPCVILLIGVNGAGKTTTAAKLSARFQMEKGNVLLAAADTFRAAAVDQLKTWGARLKVEVLAGNDGADPGSVAHDAVKRMQAGGFTHLIVDTAGRQHTKSNLMQELQKIKRVIAKALPGAPHETWLVVDGTTGGNALTQAREFHSAMQLTGVIVSKLDGSAKGGMVAAISKETKLPILFIGLGEKVEDLEPFDPQLFSKAIFD